MSSLSPPRFMAALRRRERESMNGHLQALLTCRCGRQATAVLFNDGQYIGFVAPKGWYYSEGYNFDGSDQVVCCPEHWEGVDAVQR